jgi:hypothetical protein
MHLRAATNQGSLDRGPTRTTARPSASIVGCWRCRRHPEPVRPCGEPSLIRHNLQLGPRESAARQVVSVPDQTSSGDMAGSEPDALAPVLAEAGSAVAELQQLLLTTEDITGFLDQLTALTVTVLPGEVSCGITLRRERGATTVASSDSRASQVDEIQYGHDEGPCLRSLATGQVVAVDDLVQDDRWGSR